MQIAWQKWLPLPLIAGFVFSLDQISKAWIINTLNVGETIQVIPALYPYFQFTRSMNTGIAFGMGEGGSMIFLVLSIIIVFVLMYLYIRSAQDARLQHIAFAIVIGGALGNVIDRIQHGHVVDFFHVVIPNLISNVSNFADHAIIIGVVLLLIDSYLEEQREKQKIAETEAIAPDSNQKFD